MFNFGKKKKDDNQEQQDAVVENIASEQPVETQIAQNTNSEAEKKGVFSKVKDKAVEKMLEKQLKNVPPQQREMLMTAMKNNPEFFEKIAKEIEAETKKGKNQMAASMEVMRKHQGELQKILMGGSK
jgi:signal recognition particle subunit SEC65